MKYGKAAIVGMLVVSAGCEAGGVYPLLSRRDVIEACTTASSTWIRTEGVGTDTSTVRTEVLIIGTMSPATTVIDFDSPRCFQRMVLEYDASTRLEVGSYTLDALGDGTFLSGSSYRYNIRRVPLFQREGAVREDHTIPEAHTLHLEEDAGTLLATYDGVQHRYTNIFDVNASLDPTTQLGAEQTFLMMNVPLFLSQVRVGGFGSARMTTYLSTATFNGIIGGSFTVNVATLLNPTATIDYMDFVDMTGTYVHGAQITRVNTQGTGPMDGIVEIRLREGPLLTDMGIVGTIDYDTIHINDGFPDSGDFKLDTTVPSVTSHLVSYTFANEIDLRPTLPVATP